MASSEASTLCLTGVDPDLASVLECIAAIVNEASRMLREANAGAYSGAQNAFGDEQLKVDVEVDNMVFERLRSCSAVEAASSEEQPEIVQLPGKGYTVAFDPLDGSSIIGANFAVGSIFGIWPGALVGSTGRAQAAAAYAVYGPQTLLVIARPRQGLGSPLTVEEYLLTSSNAWTLRRTNVAIAPTLNVFAPANLRAASGNKVYNDLISLWIARNFTLRYTGGMVPDVHHILAKGGGVFCNPGSAAAPAKLRLVFECAPLSFIIEAAGGMSHDGHGSVLDQAITSTATRSLICLGSRELVQESIPAMQAAPQPS